MRVQIEKPGSMSPLRFARLVRGLRLSDLAERTGIHPSTLSRVETGRREPKPQEITALARALGISEAEILAKGKEEVR